MKITKDKLTRVTKELTAEEKGNTLQAEITFESGTVARIENGRITTEENTATFSMYTPGKMSYTGLPVGDTQMVATVAQFMSMAAEMAPDVVPAEDQEVQA